MVALLHIYATDVELLTGDASLFRKLFLYAQNEENFAMMEARDKVRFSLETEHSESIPIVIMIDDLLIGRLQCANQQYHNSVYPQEQA